MPCPFLSVAALLAIFQVASCQIRGPADVTAEEPAAAHKRELQSNSYPNFIDEPFATAHEAHAAWPRDLKVMPLKDEAMEAEIARIVGNMTLEAKIAQMVMVAAPDQDVEGITAERGYSLGNLLSGPGAHVGTHQPEEWTAQANVYFESAAEQGDVRIPYLWGMDAIHGHNNQPTGTVFPHNIGLGAANDTDLMKRIGEITAIEVALTGVDWAFAPCVANPQNLRWGRVYEGYSADMGTIRRLSVAMIKGLQGDVSEDGGKSYLDARHVMASAKHWIAEGATEEGIDAADTFLDEEDLINEHALPYFDAIEAGVGSIMISFSRVNGTKMHGHQYLIQSVLKDTLGFDGIVVSDFNGHQFVLGCDVFSCPQSVNAGIDVYMLAWGEDWSIWLQNTASQVRDGTIPESRIDDAATRVIRLKARMGMIPTIKTPNGPRPTPSERAAVLTEEGHSLGAPEHRAVAREAVQKSLVMLKNNDNVLPLSTDMRILVAGRAGDNIALQCGGWTVDWQGSVENTNEVFGDATSILGGIKEKNITVDFSYNLDPADTNGTYDAVIVVVAENPYAEVAGDIRINQTISFVHIGGESDNWFDLEVLSQARAKFPDIPLITVMLTGRPLYSNQIINLSDGFVVAWLPGSEGGGVADVLFGEKNMTGRLPFDWPTDPCDASTNSGHYGGIWHIGGGLPYGYNRTMKELPEHPVDKYFTCMKFKSDLIHYTTPAPVDVGEEENPELQEA
ncbi:unnamed protein product [Vitrella brassicaformis CCMP3155]|uniref:Beta-glucosidase n=3 Tax=Vitrella brassicaformis TaxID=1169539 RepID=A0A0G4GMG4_VITBC|nr:unnamed protein product [Vitrella brassicaformis CCMP3155]|eukprot:CEM31384.1 unnamed protein product [Vitrella brassicaformis CCMP3155]